MAESSTSNDYIVVEGQYRLETCMQEIPRKGSYDWIATIAMTNSSRLNSSDSILIVLYFDHK